MKRKRRKAHTIGRDFLSGRMFHYYNFCPDCGAKITKAIIKRQEAM